MSLVTVEARGGGYLLLWLLITFLPGVFALESPSFLRLIALAPAAYLVWALGITRLTRLASLLPVGTRRRAGLGVSAALAVGLVTFEGASTYHDYFAVWAPSEAVYRDFDTALVSIAATIENTPPADYSTFVYADSVRSRQVDYLSANARQARWLQGYSSVLLLPDQPNEGALYVFSGFEYGNNPTSRYFAGLNPLSSERDPAGDTTHVAYRVSPLELGGMEQVAIPASHQLAGQVELVGGTIERAEVSPGQQIGVTLLWRALTDSPTVYAPYLHVVDDRGHGWGQDETLGSPANGWRAGDRFISRLIWTAPVDAPPMEYEIEVGMATRAGGWPPGPSTALGQPIELGRVAVKRPASPPSEAAAPEIGHIVGADLGAGLWLAGYDGSLGQVKSGDRLSLDLVWQARQMPSVDVIVDLKLVDESGQTVAQDWGRPAYGRFGTKEWQSGALVRDPRSLTVGAGASPGTARLVVETSDADSGKTIASKDIGSVQIVETARSFTLPRMSHMVDATFGGQIALRGFDVAPESLTPGQTLSLSLYWQAMATPSRNYTVFTHLLDSRNRVVAQQDGVPLQGQSPTLGWVAGQVVEDRYLLTLKPDQPAEELLLEVGLYDAVTGERLKLQNGDDRVILTKVRVSAGDSAP